MIMSNFSGLTLPEGYKEEKRMVNREAIKFKYPGAVDNNCKYKGVVENPNELKHYGGYQYQIVMDSAWLTMWWPISVFDFS